MLSSILIALLALQANPNINWKSELKQSDKGNQIVLTGDIRPGVDHVYGTVDVSSCEGVNCFSPEEFEFDHFIEKSGFSAFGTGLPTSADATVSSAPTGASASTVAPSSYVLAAAPQSSDSAGQKGESTPLWPLVLEAILWGFAMLLTPCVFPMVPMTVSFFMKGSETPARGRVKAFLYGLFIVLLYTVPISAIIGITWIVGGSGVTADIFNWLSTHWLPNIIFFLVFMVFAASFFGAFEITLPSKWTNGADKKSDKKGLAGIFFLALTLVLVSFSCTGPIVGTVLIKSTQGEFWAPMLAMLAFSVAFALPFTLLALFPSLLKKLPKSGGWLNSVKVVLGFIEIALGLKFLSTADQTYHWHILDREVYLAIWIVVFTLLGLYLLGKIRFRNDSPVEYVSVKRLLLAIIDFAFVVYLIPGMWGAPLKALSGYMPPMETQDFVLGGESRLSGGSATERAISLGNEDAPLTIAHGLKAFDNVDAAVAAAKKSVKRVFVDITGHGCVNCREMESRVWSDPEVLSRLGEDFEIVALYVDDKTKLPESQWIKNDSGKFLKDVGRVNSYIALSRFGVNSQPNYFILDSDGKILKGPRAYNLDIDGYIDFLSE